ncbi:MAG: mercury(II) reductase [DPANN group archaeon]|nr:mercury(II) reductase [DPANN group archaeon]
MTKTYDLIIIGGGAAAFAAANTANRLKKKTLIINDQDILPLGGTCVNVGCVPSKIMLHQGALSYYAQRNRFRALKIRAEADFMEALKETREMVLAFQEKNYGQVIAKQEFVDFKEGHGTFKDAHTVAVGEEEFHTDHILIASGASTHIPPIKGIASIDYLTNKSLFFDLKTRPKSVIILGGGAEAMEFSQIFHHFGIPVTVIQRSKRILTKHDADIANELQSILEEEGIIIHTGTSIREVTKDGDSIMVHFDKEGTGEMKITAERLFMAQGLRPHTDTMGIDASGVQLDERGFVKVDEHLQTNQAHIYAAGDVTGIMPLETVAAKQGSIAAGNMFGQEKLTIDYQSIPHAVFTSPQVAAVGITEEEFMRKYRVCLCRTISWKHVEKAVAIKEDKGILRMVIDPRTKVVLGVHVVGPLAADIITTAAYAIRNKMTIYDIRDTVHVFPTLSEVIKKAAQSFDQNLDDMACCVE